VRSKACMHCGGRGHTAITCKATDLEVLIWRLGGLAKDWETTKLSSNDPLIKSRESTINGCGLQLNQFLREFQKEIEDQSPRLIDKMNTRGIQELFPSLRFHLRIRG